MNNKELELRKGIWKELKRFINVGTEAVLLEDSVDVFYDTRELSLTLEKILALARKYPINEQ